MDLDELIRQISDDAEDELLLELIAHARADSPARERLPALDRIFATCDLDELRAASERTRLAIWWDRGDTEDLARRAALDAAHGCVAQSRCPVDAEILSRAWTTGHRAWTQLHAHGVAACALGRRMLPTWTQPLDQLTAMTVAILQHGPG